MYKKALYAGSFDPLTYGHYDIIERASKQYDELVVGVLHNPSKKALFTDEEKIKMIEETVAHLPNVKVDCFEGLLVDVVNNNGFDVLVRGLRGVTDFEYEIYWAQMDARYYRDDVESVFLMTKPEYSFISSSSVKEIFKLGADITGLVPDTILKYMNEKKND